MPEPSHPETDFDSPWKEALEHYFPQFMALLFPEAHAEIDWSKSHEFLDTELQKVVRDAESGRRYTDKLVKVYTLDGIETWVLVHIEIQGNADRHFNTRMYRYHYRLQDRHPKQRIANFAILTQQRNAKTIGHYQHALWKTKLDFEFPVIILHDWRSKRASLETSTNPFAWVILAQLDAHRTKHNDTSRKASKLNLIRLLLARDYARQDILELLRVIDWMLKLPEELERQLVYEIKQLEADKMTYVMSIERFAKAEGKAEGKVEGKAEGKAEGRIEGEATLLRRLLTKRFGPLPEPVRARIEQATIEQLDAWAERILDAPTLLAVFEER